VHRVPNERFRGTCHRAANWSWLRQTQARGRNDRYRLSRVPIKDIYVRHCKDFLRKHDHMTSLRSSTLALRDEKVFSPRLDPIGMSEVLDADLSGYFDTIPHPCQ
jgi:hypothetical protein